MQLAVNPRCKSLQVLQGQQTLRVADYRVSIIRIKVVHRLLALLSKPNAQDDVTAAPVTLERHYHPIDPKKAFSSRELDAIDRETHWYLFTILANEPLTVPTHIAFADYDRRSTGNLGGMTRLRSLCSPSTRTHSSLSSHPLWVYPLMALMTGNKGPR